MSEGMGENSAKVLSYSANDAAEDEISLLEIYHTLLDSYRLILVVTVLIASMAIVYAILATPIYRADALLQVESKTSSVGGLAELDSLLTGDVPAATEIEIIRSRSVQGKVVDQLHLDTLATPHYFPIIGRWLARRHAYDNALVEPFLGLSNYAWGGEKIRLDRLTVPKDMEGQRLTLVAGKQGQFKLLNKEDQLLLSGQVGQQTKINNGLSLFVSDLVARPGTRFDLVKKNWLDAVNGLQKSLKVSEKGKKTGVFLMTMEHADPQYAIEALNATANVYLRQNVERKSEEAEKALSFLKSQLPEIKSQLDGAEIRLNDYRLERGSLDVGLEVQALLEQSAELEQRISEIKLKKLELGRKYTDNHPLMQSLEDKLKRLTSEQGRLENKVKALPDTEQKVLRLMRDVKVQTELYTLLLNKTQELKVAKAGTVSNVRILDYAVVPNKAVKPKKPLIVALGFVMGLFLGVLIVFIRKGMQKGMQTAEDIEKKLGLTVYASIPHADQQVSLFETMRKNKAQSLGGDFLLASVAETDLAIESLRSLRTNLHFGMMDADNNRVMITGAAPSVGKSFVSANLGHVLSMADKKVLLVDADLRKGHLAAYFGLANESGLSECIRGDVPFKQAVQSTRFEHLDILSTGEYPPNPSELLMTAQCKAILDEASTQYDIVLIDTPPVLAVTDAVIIGKMVGTTFLLLRAGQHPLQEVQQAVRHLENGGAHLKGAILNDVIARRSQYGYGSYQYAYK